MHLPSDWQCWASWRVFPWHLDALFSLKYSTLKCFASFLKIGSYVSLLRLEHVHSVFYGHKSFIRYVVCKYCFLACGLSFCLLKYLSKRRFLTLIKSCLQFFSTVVQSLSHVGLFATPWTAAYQASLSFHYLPKFAQTHVHWVDDAIQQSHPLSSPSPPALNLSEHRGLFHWVGSLHQVAKVLELQLQYQSF